MTLYLVTLEQVIVDRYVVDAADAKQAEMIAASEHMNAKAHIFHSENAPTAKSVRLRADEEGTT
jgi:hypothetical protein